MKTPTGQLDTLRSGIGRLLDACNQAPVADGVTALPELVPAFEQLLDVMARIEADSGSARQSDSGDITEIGEYAQQLTIRLAVVVDTLELKEQREPVVDAIAQAANSTRDTEQLEALSHQIGRIIAAVPAVISQDLERVNPGRP